MHEEIRASRLRVTRRRALSIGGTLGLGGFLAACGSDGGGSGSATGATTATVETTAGTTATVQPSSTAAADVVALLDRAATCTLAQEETQGPYWFDVDSIRSDVREDRPGTRLALALRVQDMAQCKVGGEAAPVANAVVEIWHCDAGGSYSGFESGAMGPPGDSGSGETSDGSYSQGDSEATTSDDGTYLRGARRRPTETASRSSRRSIPAGTRAARSTSI
ncbi:MAG TPA: hypothetical protein VLK58_06560 [Conexibacter sp.]|nr:hypothetical protein [Conexibacter sp.]